MTSQLDERPAQTLNSSPNRNQSPSRGRPRMLAAAAVAVLALGAGLIVAVERTDGARSRADKLEHADAPVLGVNGGVLPAHLQEFEARVEAGSLGGGVLPAHLQEFEARVEAGSLGGDES